MTELVDLNIVGIGETATPLQKLLQEIDIIMTTNKESLLTNYNKGYDLEYYLFKTKVDSSVVERRIMQMITTNITSAYDFDISVSVQFISTRANKDLMYINVTVDGSGNHEKLSYTLG